MSRLLIPAAILSALLACKPKEAAPECIDNGECGNLQICAENVCTDVDCVDSTTCDLEEFCDEASHECVDGCESDDDCEAGDECDGGECEPYECRTTALDCAIGQFCSGGECEDAGPEFCEPGCRRDNDCTGDAECVIFDYTSYYEFDGYCLPSCAVGGQDECPRGYECRDLSYYGLGTLCYADCTSM